MYTAGKGSTLLVCLHLFSKAVQLWGGHGTSSEHSADGWHREDEDETVDSKSVSEPNGLIAGLGHVLVDAATTVSSVHLASQAYTQLAERGQLHSPLVSLGLSRGPLAEHWLLRGARIYLGFLVNAWRQLLGISIPASVPPSPSNKKAVSQSQSQPPTPPISVVSLLRAGTGLALSIAGLLGAISVASVLQRDAGIFPDLINFHVRPDSITFDHRVANVTLQRVHHPLNHNETDDVKRIEPLYAACDWRWTGVGRETGSKRSSNASSPSDYGLTLLDLALLSEVAYISDSSQNLQFTLDVLFPDLDFHVVHISSYTSPSAVGEDEHTTVTHEGPMYLEARSERLGLTVIAVRGTDVGRLRDLLEDAKLYAEPVIFSLLGVLFPPMQMWSDVTAGAIVQLLHESTRFFSPLATHSVIVSAASSGGESVSVPSESQGRGHGHGYDRGRGTSESRGSPKTSSFAHAEYFQPLVNRALQLSAEGHEVLLTGHSLGGGLAGMVGAFTGTPSVAYSSPGLGLSYRKFRALLSDGSTKRLWGTAALHHRSLSVVTEFDWYVNRTTIYTT